MNERLNVLRLIRTNGIGPRSFHSLVAKFGNEEAALNSLGAKAYPKQKAEDEIALCKKLGIGILLYSDTHYPESLRRTYDAPPVLFYKGDINLLGRGCIGVVGTRNSSAAGMALTRKISADLGAYGFVVVSGLARGIDTEAHKASLASGTIAVVAGGLDVIYPPENKKLFDEITRAGLIVGENAAGTEPLARHFPQRNRIIAGISAGLLVVEAAKKSGSMITADYALREGRDVFAVPGSPLDPRSGGTNYLIKNGAVLTESANDIIENLGKGVAPQLLDLYEEKEEMEYEGPAALPTHEGGVISILSVTPIGVDEIVRQTNIPVYKVNRELLELELEGKIKRTIGNKVILAS